MTTPSDPIPSETWALRLATEEDIPRMEELIPLSVRALQAPYYTSAQMEAALGSIFGVDRQLICDGRYFVVEQNGEIIGCGGWSRRRSLYGSDHDRITKDLELDPNQDAAQIVLSLFIHSGPDEALVEGL